MKIFIVFLICLLFLVGCETSNHPMFPTQEINTTESSVTQEINDQYILRGSFGFYKGSKSMSEIKSITFSHTAPIIYDECWNANLADTEDIKGYRIGYDVIIVGDYIYANPRCSHMFAAYNSYKEPLWSSLISIKGLELLNTSYVQDMTMMFAFCQLTELNGIEQWDVSHVKTFAGMFQGNNNAGDIKIKYLDVSQWDTSSAENLSHIFYGCGQIEYIPIENWDVSKVKTFSHMFADCHNLKSVDFSKWQTLSVESFDAFLNDCHSLTQVDVTGLDTGTCKQFSQMFESCINLERIIGLDTWDVSNASHYAFSETFHCCYNLKEIDIGNWVSAPDNTARMFKNCYNITQIDLSGFDMTNNLHSTEMFMNCNSLIEVVYNKGVIKND